MQNYYHFVRNTRRFSLIILMNVCLLALMYWAFESYLFKGESESVVFIAVVVIECILLGIASYLWVIDKKVEIRISSNEFYYHDPIFGNKELTIPVRDIVELAQIQSATHSSRRNLLRLQNGNVYELMYQNYNVDRQAMFNALQRANGKIELPEHIWAYKLTRPKWAEDLRNKFGLEK